MLQVIDWRREHGYLVGDAVLSEVGVVLGKSLRATDLLARLGSEKFASMITEASAEDAERVCARILESVRSHSFAGLEPGVVRLSLGAASFPGGSIETVDELINAALSRLDQAKEKGGGRAVTSEG